MDIQNKGLFREFPPTSPSDWEKKIREELRGADYDKKLIWKPNEGFAVRPYYTGSDLDGLEFLQVFPGVFPFVRGKKKTGNEWFIRQDIHVSDLKRANEKALDILMKGIDSLGFILEEDKSYSKEDLDLLLRNIFAEMVEINFQPGKDVLALMQNHYEMLVRYNRDFLKIHGSMEYNPLGRLLTRGNFFTSKDDDLEECRHLIQAAEHLPNFTVILVNGDHFHNAGSTAVEELAFSLSQGAEYLTLLTERGLSINQVAPKIKFRFATGSNYFMEIAKLRAARLLWAHIVKAYGPSKEEVAAMNIHVTTSKWNKAAYDPYVNMLRTTTEAMSSIIAGIDSMTVVPFSEVYQKPDDFAERIARNQQLLLKEESYLDKVADPSSGSYYIENLTRSVADEAWKLFLEIDAKGGFAEAVVQGVIQQKIHETARKRDMDIACRKEIFLGVNQYPDFTESRQEETNPGGQNGKRKDNEKPSVEVLRLYRGPEAFEEIRFATDQFARGHKRPSVFLFTYGNLAMRVARSQFARNFFACAGFEVIDNLGFNTIEDGVKAFTESKAEILVICSSDEEYPVIAPAIGSQVDEKAVIVVAGYPKDHIEELKSKGIMHFIHVRSNVLEELKKFQDLAGVK